MSSVKEKDSLPDISLSSCHSYELPFLLKQASSITGQSVSIRVISS